MAHEIALKLTKQIVRRCTFALVPASTTIRRAIDGRQLLWLLILAVSLAALSGCVESREYFYVEVISPTFDVVETGKSTIGETRLYHWSHEDMPVQLRRDFDEYTISVRVPLAETRALLKFSAHSKDGILLGVHGAALSDCYGVFDDSQGWLRENTPSSEITFAWEARMHDGCQHEPPIDQSLKLIIRVYDTDGTELGLETIEVGIVENGRYIYLDGP